MARRIEKTRYFSDIKTQKQLREARLELELRAWYAGEKIANDASDMFTVENLLSIIAPSGSVADRIVGGVGTGIATVKGLSNAIRMFRSKRRGCGI